MKKAIIYSMLLFVTASVSAQETGTNTNISFKSKNGHEVLPQAGEWALGLSATSFLQYAGNFLNGANATNGAPAVANANGPTINTLGNIGGIAIMGKYMLNSTTAIRGRFQANSNSTVQSLYSLKNSIIPNPLKPEYVEDKLSTSTNAFLLSGGLEKRRGSTRLQGVYGAEVLVGIISQSHTATYGNDMNIDFNAPASSAFTGVTAPGVSGGNWYRVLEQNNGTQFFMGARGFVGVEYFIAPKISLGAEVGYTLGYQTNGSTYTVSETYDSGTQSVVKVETARGTRNNTLRSWGVGLDNVNAGLNMFFYF